MGERISGKLRVTDHVLLEVGDDTIFVLVQPLYAALGWGEMIRQSVETLRGLDGQEVTLEGDLMWGFLLVSAHVVQDLPPRDGTYRGLLEAADGNAVSIDLRFHSAELVASADFFRTGSYYASLRTKLAEAANGWTGTAPRVIFDWESTSSLGGSLVLRRRTANVIHVECVLPEAVPTTYTGDVSFESPYFRILNIEVDKLGGLPWPPQLSTADIPPSFSRLASGPGSLHRGVVPQGRDRRSADAQPGSSRRRHRTTNRPARRGGPLGRARDARDDGDALRPQHGRPRVVALPARGQSLRWWAPLRLRTREVPSRPRRPDPQRRRRHHGDHLRSLHRSDRRPLERVVASRSCPSSAICSTSDDRESFENVRARQGAAVFWTEFLDFFATLPAWDRDRRFLRTVVHELGHALNLAHSWLVNRADSTSFMQYPQNYPHGNSLGERDTNYWRDFDYAFDPEEIFHFLHGFYNEVVPGGKQEFMVWTPSSVFRDPRAGGTRANLALYTQGRCRVLPLHGAGHPRRGGAQQRA